MRYALGLFALVVPYFGGLLTGLDALGVWSFPVAWLAIFLAACAMAIRDELPTKENP